MPKINGIPISPRAKRALTARGLAVSTIQGSGPGGRIVEADLARAQSSPKTAGTRKALSPMRRTIAQRTTESWTVPHFYLRAEVDATKLLGFREEELKKIESAHGIRTTVTDLFVKAIGVALKKFPETNSVWREDSIEQLSEANVGLVVSVPDGLFIPVIRAADSLSLGALAQQRRGLVEAARSFRLGAEQTEGAGASLSNLGNSRVDEFSAILPPGQTSMLTIGRIAPRPFVLNGNLALRPTVKLSLSVDHRVLDGESAAEFLGCIIEGLEDPARLF